MLSQPRPLITRIGDAVSAALARFAGASSGWARAIEAPEGPDSPDEVLVGQFLLVLAHL